MKRKLSLIITAIALCSLMLISGTLAWFTDTKSLANDGNFTNAKLRLSEVYQRLDSTGKKVIQDLSDDEITKEDSQKGITGLVPGDQLKKIPTIENVGGTDLLIRVKLTYSGSVFTLTNGVSVQDDLIAKISKDDWYIVPDTDKKVITLYKKTILPGSDSTSNKALRKITIFNLFKNFEADKCTNEFFNADFNLDVHVDGIQSANMNISKSGNNYTLEGLKTAFDGKKFEEVK
ncbi:hypothetical protein lbkm_1984 [Lachnospiraceae bacterium KM106-2]|nr:hypothetical protein lbkm_1984 [Lachnospiraceae bacterium KM106-2]